MEPIKYFKGDAADSRETIGPKIIAHIVNDLGAWGKGFVVAIGFRWPVVRQAYKGWRMEQSGFDLGRIQIVRVAPTIRVANMIAQRGLRGPGNPKPINYPSLHECLSYVRDEVALENATVVMPRIGCGLAGGTWEEVEPIIQEELSLYDVKVHIYDL